MYLIFLSNKGESHSGFGIHISVTGKFSIPSVQNNFSWIDGRML